MVVVDRRYDIQSINGVARRLLAIHGAAIGDDLDPHRPGGAATTRCARRSTARSARANADQPAAASRIEEMPDRRTRRYLQIICYPQRAEDDRGPVETVLLVVNDVTDTMQARDERSRRRGRGRRAGRPGGAGAAPGGELARLAETNRQLMAANQELLGTNEELRTANEEFLLSVEEAQASTEEIETLNEEMQATNEELETLNEELQATVEELNTTNDELHARSIELQEVAMSSQDALVQPE